MEARLVGGQLVASEGRAVEGVLAEVESSTSQSVSRDIFGDQLLLDAALRDTCCQESTSRSTEEY